VSERTAKEGRLVADRITAEEARRRVVGGQALLVCAYEDEAHCDRIRLEGAISFRDFQARADALPKDQELIFYCA
jgi:hypothetical protein